MRSISLFAIVFIAACEPSSSQQITSQRRAEPKAADEVPAAARRKPMPTEPMPIGPSPMPSPIPSNEPAKTIECFAEHRLIAAMDWVSPIAVAHVDEDGKADILSMSMHREDDGEFIHYLQVFLGDGHGGFEEIGDPMAIGDMVLEFAMADYNRDGHIDFAVQRLRDRDLRVFTGDGKGHFRLLRAIPTSRKPTGVTTGDVDGDGNPDLVASFHEYMQVFLGNGRGRFRGLRPHKLGRAVDGPVLADGDGDGDLDYFLLNNDDATYAALRGDGKGRFKVVDTVPACGSPSFPALADFDGNGVMDVAYACIYTRGGIEIRLGGDKVEAGPALTVQSGSVESFAAADFTGDGHVDIVSMGREQSNFSSDIRLLQGSGDGHFRARSAMSMPGTVSDATAADIDGDGRPDLVAAFWPGRKPGFIAIWRNTCGATVASSTMVLAE